MMDTVGTEPLHTRLRNALDALEWTQAQGADACGCNPRTFRRWLRVDGPRSLARHQAAALLEKEVERRAVQKRGPH